MTRTPLSQQYLSVREGARNKAPTTDGLSYLPSMVGLEIATFVTPPFWAGIGYAIEASNPQSSTSNQGGDLRRDLDSILQAQEDSYHLLSAIVSTARAIKSNSNSVFLKFSLLYKRFQELNNQFEDFDLQLGDSKNDLGRISGLL
ncbi:hypothetical protein M9H77_23220 [Catharanthus roseus]|uniref:Uncharacterized protein n=1 Tax=Catharanthus roseus TaxID=4058 RepID=A0ACC0ASA9_CATRO|nr:hypothetical protein M9H77_23220 [Catharanthus roseus]